MIRLYQNKEYGISYIKGVYQHGKRKVKFTR